MEKVTLPKVRVYDLVKFLKFKQYQWAGIRIPISMANDINILARACFLNGVSFKGTMEYVFITGFNLFKTAIQKHNIISFTEMLSISKFIDRFLTEILRFKDGEYALSSEAITLVCDFCKTNNLNPSDIFNYLERNKDTLFGVDDILITPEKMGVIIEKYIRSTVPTNSSSKERA